MISTVYKSVRHLIKLLFYKLGIGEFARKIVVNHEECQKVKRLQRLGPEILENIIKALSSVKVPYFAEFGTLLGIVREGGLLAHDMDMDFSLPPGANASDALKALTENGFEFYWGFEYEGRITEFTVLWEGVHVDFFLYFKDADGLYYQDYIDNYDDTHSKIVSWTARRLRYPDLESITSCKVYGLEIPIPSNYDSWLTAQYGNWRVPNKDWNYAVNNDKSRTQILDGLVKTVDLRRTLELLERQ